MAGPVELHGIESTHPGKPVEREVPGQCVRPFVAEHLDGLRLAQVPVELDHEPFFPPKALAQDRFGQPGGPDDNGEGWRAFPSKAGFVRAEANGAVAEPDLVVLETSPSRAAVRRCSMHISPAREGDDRSLRIAARHRIADMQHARQFWGVLHEVPCRRLHLSLGASATADRTRRAAFATRAPMPAGLAEVSRPAFDSALP